MKLFDLIAAIVIFFFMAIIYILLFVAVFLATIAVVLFYLYNMFNFKITEHAK